MNKEIKNILKQFKGFTDGTRMLMVIHRNTDGGCSHNCDRSSTRKISNNEIEFEEILEEFLEIKKESKNPLRIYSSVNKRDFSKGIREFKRRALEADYYDIVSRDKFYLNIRNQFLGSIMKPNARAETKFLIDIDNVVITDTETYPDEVIKHLKDIKVKIFMVYRTKNGFHIITEPFNPNLFNYEFGEIKKDGLLLLSY